MKTININGVELTERKYSVAWYGEAKKLLDILKTYIQRETENEFNELLKHSEAFAQLSGGISLDDLIESESSKEQIAALTGKITKNLKENPESLKLIQALLNYNDRLNSVKESFVTENSLIKNEYGVETMISNLRLILKTHYEGSFDQIDFNTEDVEMIIQLISSGLDALEDFFNAALKLKDQFKISPMTMKIMRSKENQT